ncbi:hypothetical protein RB653_002770 [Dictyostelium firmibasis]|uniref:Major facilitator superfamily (MFS) profile domain-containing protein n=1 Tax=Dictyostelium firmibasis TaxID=79012 RepID=A0AAN7YVW5_9MYCE
MPPNSNLKFDDNEIRIIGPETPLIKKDDEKENIKIPLIKHKYIKQTILLYIIFFVWVMSTFLYGVIIPNMLVDYVAFKFPSLNFDDQQSKAAYYKSYSDALPNLTMFLLGPLIGVFSDRYGRKKILYLAVFSSIIDMASCFISMYTHNLAYYYVFHTLGGINVVMQPAVFSYIADIFDEDHVPILYSFAGAALGIGVVIGPLIFVFISSLGSQFIPLYVTGGLMSLCFIGIPFLPESLEIAKQNNKIQETISTFNPFKLIYSLLKSSGYIFWVVLVFASINYTGQDLINDYYYFASLLYGWGSTQNGYYLAALGSTIIIWGAFIIPLMLKYFSQRRVITFGYCCSLFAHIMFVFAGVKVKHNYVIFLVGSVFVGFVPNNMNIIQAVISGCTPANMQGSVLTGANAIAGLANFVGSIAANDILMYFSSPDAPIFFPPAIFLINGVVVLITLISTILIWRAYKNPPTTKNLKEQQQKLDSENIIN